MMNLKLVEDQPRWRVAVVAIFAKLMGVLIHVEGIPFGSNRTRIGRFANEMGARNAGQALGTSAGAGGHHIPT